MSRPEPTLRANLGRVWREYRVAFRTPTAFAAFAAGPVPDLLDELTATGAVRRHLFVRKSPGLRLRAEWDRPSRDDPILVALQVAALEAEGPFGAPGIVAPYRERELFGGEAAADLVEDFLAADSSLVLRLARAQACSEATPTPPQVTVALLNALFAAGAEDAWEHWAMWQRLADLRGGREGAVRARQSGLVVADVPELAAACGAAATMTRALSALANSGGLEVPLRELLPVVAAFHMNRMGYDQADQVAIARAEAAGRALFRIAARSAAPVLCPVAFERVALGPREVFTHPALQAGPSPAEAALIGLAGAPETAAVLAWGPDRLAARVAGLAGKVPAAWTKRERRAGRTLQALLWRSAGRVTPYGDLAATRVFDPSAAGLASTVSRRPARDRSDPFRADRFDPRPGGPLPNGMPAALSVAAAAFSGRGAKGPAQHQILLAQVTRRLGLEHRLPLDVVAGRADQAADAAELAPAWAGSLPHLAAALCVEAPTPPHGLPPLSAVTDLALPPPDPMDGAPRRAALRLQAGPDGRMILRFLGADRMSLLARYLPPQAMTQRRAAAAWLARWPAILDVTPGASGHELDRHAPLTLRGAAHFGRLWLVRDPGSGLVGLEDENGLPVHAVHFGVSSPLALSTAAQLALAAGTAPPSWGASILEAINPALACVMLDATDVVALPEVIVEQALVLVPLMVVIPPGAPVREDLLAGRVDRAAAALRGRGLDAGPVRVTALGATEPQVVDLRCPEGARIAGRLAAEQPVLLEPLTLGADGRATPEYYIELAEGAEDR